MIDINEKKKREQKLTKEDILEQKRKTITDAIAFLEPENCKKFLSNKIVQQVIQENPDELQMYKKKVQDECDLSGFKGYLKNIGLDNPGMVKKFTMPSEHIETYKQLINMGIPASIVLIILSMLALGGIAFNDIVQFFMNIIIGMGGIFFAIVVLGIILGGFWLFDKIFVFSEKIQLELKHLAGILIIIIVGMIAIIQWYYTWNKETMNDYYVLCCIICFFVMYGIAWGVSQICEWPSRMFQGLYKYNPKIKKEADQYYKTYIENNCMEQVSSVVYIDDNLEKLVVDYCDKINKGRGLK